MKFMIDLVTLLRCIIYVFGSRLFSTSNLCFGTYDPRFQQHELFRCRAQNLAVVKVLLALEALEQISIFVSDECLSRQFVCSSGVTATLRRVTWIFEGFLSFVLFAISLHLFGYLLLPVSGAETELYVGFVSARFEFILAWGASFRNNYGDGGAFSSFRKVWKCTRIVSPVWFKALREGRKGGARDFFFTSGLYVELGWCVQTRGTRSWGKCMVFFCWQGYGKDLGGFKKKNQMVLVLVLFPQKGTWCWEKEEEI